MSRAGLIVQPVDSNHVAAFLRHYQNQYGSGFPVYRGDRLQSGAGLGSILRGIGRFLFPILAPAAKTFIGSTMEAREQGKSFKEAARSALTPTLQSAISTTTEQIAKRMSGPQKGGRRRKRRRRQQTLKNVSHKKQRRGRKRMVRKHMVYKGMFGSGRKHKRQTHRRKRSRKRVRFLKPTFANF